MALSLNITDIQLFNTLKEKLGEKEAEALVGFVKTSIKAEIEPALSDIATKEFVRAEIAGVKGEIAGLKGELAGVKGELETKIAETKFKLILWAFVFWATQLGAIFAFLKFLK